MLSSSLSTMLKLSKTSFPEKLFDYDCVTLYVPLIPPGGGGGGLFLKLTGVKRA